MARVCIPWCIRRRMSCGALVTSGAGLQPLPMGQWLAGSPMRVV